MRNVAVIGLGIMGLPMAINLGKAGSRVLDQKGEKVLDRDFDPGFRLALHHKDLGIVTSAAREANVAVPPLADPAAAQRGHIDTETPARRRNSRSHGPQCAPGRRGHHPDFPRTATSASASAPPAPAGPDRFLRVGRRTGRGALCPGQRRGQPAPVPAGAAVMFGPQKGATPEDVTALDAALSHLVDVLAAEIGPRAVKSVDAPGAGAAGGLGYAAIAVLAATRRPGIDVVLEFTGLADRLAGADLVITGEGSLDEQRLLCKTPLGVARVAALGGIPVIAVCGRTTLGPEQLQNSGFREVHTLTELESNVDTCIADAGPLLERLGRRIGEQLAAPAPATNADTKEAIHA